MTFGTEDVQSTEIRDTVAKFDVCSTPGHVGGNRDRTALPCTGHNLGFLPVILCVEHIVRNLFPFQHPAQEFRCLDARSADKDRLALGIASLDFVDSRAVFLSARFINAIVVVIANHWTIRWDDDNVQFVDVVELVRLGFGSASHSRQFVVETEVVLNSDRSECLSFAIDLDPFFCLDGLMQTIAPATSRHLSPGVLIDDEDLIFLDDVIDIFLEQAVSAKELGNIVYPFGLAVTVLLAQPFGLVLARLIQLRIQVDIGEFGDQDSGMSGPFRKDLNPDAARRW